MTQNATTVMSPGRPPVFEIRGRQIVRERRIYDFTGLLLQIGVLKAKPA